MKQRIPTFELKLNFKMFNVFFSKNIIVIYETNTILFYFMLVIYY